MSDTKIKIKDSEKSYKGKDGKSWKIKVTGKEVNFGEKPEKGKTESNETVKVEYREDKEGTEYKSKDLKVKYNSGYFLPDVKLPKVIDTDCELKEEVSLPVKGFQMGAYISVAIFVLLIAGLIWWWVASSRKEDKEEEGL